MLEKFGEWFIKYNDYISWWLIGWMSFATLDSLGRGNYVFALLDAGVAYFNYHMWKTRQ